MSDPPGITHGLSAHRRGLVAAMLGFAVVAGAISYVLIERATALRQRFNTPPKPMRCNRHCGWGSPP